MGHVREAHRCVRADATRHAARKAVVARLRAATGRVLRGPQPGPPERARACMCAPAMVSIVSTRCSCGLRLSRASSPQPAPVAVARSTRRARVRMQNWMFKPLKQSEMMPPSSDVWTSWK